MASLNASGWLGARAISAINNSENAEPEAETRFFKTGWSQHTKRDLFC